MAKIEARLVMALRQLTGQPVLVCRDALAEAGGDIAVVIRKLRRLPCCGLYASDAEVSSVLASHGVSYTPEGHQPVPVPDDQVVAELTAYGMAVSNYFLINGLVCSVNARGQLVGLSIDDPDLAAATKEYLRRIGVPEYTSMRAYLERNQVEPGAAADRGGKM